MSKLCIAWNTSCGYCFRKCIGAESRSISFVLSNLSVSKCLGDVEPQSVSAFLASVSCFFHGNDYGVTFFNQIDPHLLIFSGVEVPEYHMLWESVGLFALLESVFKRMSCEPYFVSLVGLKALRLGLYG